MSNFTQMLKKVEDGTYQLFYPVDDKKAKLPLFDAAHSLDLLQNCVLDCN